MCLGFDLSVKLSHFLLLMRFWISNHTIWPEYLNGLDYVNFVWQIAIAIISTIIIILHLKLNLLISNLSRATFPLKNSRLDPLRSSCVLSRSDKDTVKHSGGCLSTSNNIPHEILPLVGWLLAGWLLLSWDPQEI